MHESAPFREQLMKTFLGRGHSPSPDPSLREGETLFPHPSPQFGARSSSPNLRTKTKIGTPIFETKLRPWPVVIIKTMIAAHYCYNVAVSSDYSHGAIAISGMRMPKYNNGSCRRMLCYNVRNRTHNKLLINKTSHLNDDDFIIRMLYKDSY